MSVEDDPLWLDALRGVTRDGERSSAQIEGEMLREAVRKSRAHALEETSSQANVSSFDSEREEALVARAVREGLISPHELARSARRVTPVEKRRATAGLRPLAALAAALGVLAIGAAWWLQLRPDSTPVYRGEEPVHLEAPDARALKDRILSELRAAGVQAIGYEALGAQGIDADLPQPATPEVRRLLESHGIPLPEDGVLRIEIRETP